MDLCPNPTITCPTPPKLTDINRGRPLGVTGWEIPTWADRTRDLWPGADKPAKTAYKGLSIANALPTLSHSR
jgi:hypothetical protein